MSGNRRNKSRRRILTAIVIMLILCLIAAGYIISTAKHRAEARQAEQAEAERINQEQEEAEAAEEEAAAEAAEKSASHVYSHRGSAGDDELSMAAYDRAVEAGSVFIEADMVVSAEGTPYVAHEDESEVMTGYAGYFSGMTDSQIDGLKTRSGNSILKLSDLFDKYGDSVTYLIDIKYSAPRNIEAFTEIVKKYGYEKNVIAVSFFSNALSPLEETFPDMTKLYLCSDQGTFNAALGYDYADILCVPKEIMTEDNLKAAHDSNKKFSVWTLNTEEEIVQAIEMGADSYFTDDTALAVRLEQEHRAEQ